MVNVEYHEHSKKTKSKARRIKLQTAAAKKSVRLHEKSQEEAVPLFPAIQVQAWVAVSCIYSYLCPCLCVSVYLCVSVCLCVCVCISVCPCICVYLCVCLCPCLCVSVSLCLCVSVCLALPLISCTFASLGHNPSTHPPTHCCRI